MSIISIGNNEDRISVEYTFADTVEKAQELYTEEVILSQLNSSITRAAQSYLRGLVKKKKDQSEITLAFSSWQVPNGKRTVDVVGKISSQLANLSPEQKAEIKAMFDNLSD